MSDAALRVMTYNVRSLRDDLDALAGVVRAQDPDVVLVQEAPRFLRWRSKRAELARRTTLFVATAQRTGGLLVLASLRTQVRSTTFTMLPHTPGLHQRVVVTATVDHDGARWRLATVHLGGDPGERQRHLPLVREAVARAEPGFTVVGGDLNETPAGPVFSALAADLQDAWATAPTGAEATNSTRDPHRRIDALFVDPAVSVVAAGAVDDPRTVAASDHRPVVAELRAPRRR